MKFLYVTALICSVAAASPASAGIVFSQPPSGSAVFNASNESGGQNFLNAFSLSAATNLNGLDLFSGFGAVVGQSVTIKVRNSVAGTAANTNLYSFTTVLNSVSGGVLHADFSNIFLGAGNYYIGMSGSGNSEIGQDFYSSGSIPNKTIQLNQDTIQFTTNYVAGFNVYGNAATGAVPEPATWAMMLFGFGAIGGALRRRQSVATRVRFA